MLSDLYSVVSIGKITCYYFGFMSVFVRIRIWVNQIRVWVKPLLTDLIQIGSTQIFTTHSLNNLLRYQIENTS